MNSAALLDLLGNENRRRILRLLAQKPCYVTEISEYLGVSPKAVIDHLRKLEEAGLIESRVDDQRRKYFHIARNLRLEVNVSPYRFGTKSAYPASVNLDLTRCRHIQVDLSGTVDPPVTEEGEGDDTDDPADLASRLRSLEELEEELSLAQRWVQGRMTEILEQLADTVGEVGSADNRLYADVLLELQDGPASIREISEAIDSSPDLVEDVLATMADEGVVDRDEDGWRIRPDR